MERIISQLLKQEGIQIQSDYKLLAYEITRKISLNKVTFQKPNVNSVKLSD